MPKFRDFPVDDGSLSDEEWSESLAENLDRLAREEMDREDCHQLDLEAEDLRNDCGDDLRDADYPGDLYDMLVEEWNEELDREF